MSFPQTSKTLIQRLADQSHPRDWHQFLSDYWMPVCLFAQKRAGLPLHDAEDVASETFQAILQNKLLGRWISHPSSKLRTMLCTVVRHILGNRARIQQGRNKLLKENARELAASQDFPTIKTQGESAENQDIFYNAWVEAILMQAVESLMQEYHRTGKGDYFRILYGKVCEQMSVPQMSRALKISTIDIENHYKAARKRLASKLQEIVREHVERYCELEDIETEFQAEWVQLGQHLIDHGGLEELIAKTYTGSNPTETLQRQTQAISAAMQRIK